MPPSQQSHPAVALLKLKPLRIFLGILIGLVAFSQLSVLLRRGKGGASAGGSKLAANAFSAVTARGDTDALLLDDRNNEGGRAARAGAAVAGGEKRRKAGKEKECDSWDCQEAQQGRGEITDASGGSAEPDQGNSEEKDVEEVPREVADVRKPEEEGAGKGKRDKEASQPAASEEKHTGPSHECGDGSGSNTLSHTGKTDYFCCNRARTKEEIAAAFQAAASAAAKFSNGGGGSASGDPPSPMRDFIAAGGRFPILIVTYDRPQLLDNTLRSLLGGGVRCVLPSDVHIVQDGALSSVKEVIDKYPGVKWHQKVASDDDGSSGGGIAMRGGKPRDGASRIATHFRYSLHHLFGTQDHSSSRAGGDSSHWGTIEPLPQVPGAIIVEDDFLFSPDFYEYYHAVAPALEADPSLWLASAWNDNGFDYLVADPYALKRTRFFPGLGWLLPRRIWTEELQHQWPDTHWDHWMRDPSRHKGRDVIIPEINRDYHAGVKGTFMDSSTHNKYFGSIAMQADAAFTWDTPDGSDAIARILLGNWEGNLEKLLRDPATVHLTSVDEILRFGKEGGGGASSKTRHGVVWYEAQPNLHSHESMRSLAAFFGIWHEGGRGSREGVHEGIWWQGNTRLTLINYCSPGAYAALKAMSSGGGGFGYVTGTIECADPSFFKQFLPQGKTAIPSQSFPAASRPHLPVHTSLFKAKIKSPMAHLEGGHDANGPPDEGEAGNIGSGASDLVEASGSGGGHDAAAAAAAAAGGGDDGHGHDGLHSSEEGHPHAHTRFMSDLHLSSQQKALAVRNSRSSSNNDADDVSSLPSSVRLVRAKRPGMTCAAVCKAYRPDAYCSVSFLPAINSCTTMKKHFGCTRCIDSVGSDQPAMVAQGAPPDKNPGACVINGDRNLFDCNGSWQYALRLCPCSV